MPDNSQSDPLNPTRRKFLSTARSTAAAAMFCLDRDYCRNLEKRDHLWTLNAKFTKLAIYDDPWWVS